jgi:hypothetical protein
VNLLIRLIPGNTYKINETWFSKTDYSSSNYNYDFNINVESLSNIIVQTVDTLFVVKDHTDIKPRANHSKYFEFGNEEGPVYCYSNDGRILISTDSINFNHNSNRFNQNGIRAWNRQNLIGIENIAIGDTLINNSSNFYNMIDIGKYKTTYYINSIEDNMVSITFNRSIYSEDVSNKLVRREEGEIDYDSDKNYFTKIEQYTYDSNNTVFSSYYKTSIELKK